MLRFAWQLLITSVCFYFSLAQWRGESVKVICWGGEFTEERCCSQDVPECWTELFTYERCCNSSVVEKSAHISLPADSPEFVDIVTRASRSKSLNAVVGADRGPLLGALLSHSASTVPHTSGEASFSPFRVDALLETGACQQLFDALARGAWRLTGRNGALEMLLDSGDLRMQGGEEVARAARPLRDAVVGLPHNLPRNSYMRAVSLFTPWAVGEPVRQEWRLIFFPHDLKEPKIASGYGRYIPSEFEAWSPDRRQTLTFVPERNVGYLIPPHWSVTLRGPSQYLPKPQVLVCVIIDFTSETSPFWGAQVVGGVTSISDLPTFTTPTMPFPGMDWLPHIGTFSNVLPALEYERLRTALWRAPWNMVFPYYDGQHMLVQAFLDRSKSEEHFVRHFDNELMAAGQPLIDRLGALGEQTTGLKLMYYYGMCQWHEPGYDSRLHVDVNAESERRIWSAIFIVEMPVGAYREIDFFTRDSQHIGKMAPTANSAVLYPAMVYHRGKLELEGGGVSLIVTLRFAVCSSKVTEGDHQFCVP